MAKTKTSESKPAQKKISTKRTAKKATDGVKKELTEEEKAKLEAYRQRAKKNMPLKFKKNDGKAHPGPLMVRGQDDPLLHAKLAETFGTTDVDVQGHLFEQIVQTFKGVAVANDINPDGLDAEKCIDAANRSAAILAGIQPKDELESMLAVQMIAVHNMAMDTLKLAMLTGQTFEGKRSNMSYATKMFRTFMAQVETLKRYRGGGQQKMIVEHVHVNEGGQAVVGTVNTGGRRNNQSRE
jgi:hypothetical protein